MARTKLCQMAFHGNPQAELFGSFLANILALILLALLGEYLWNNVLAKVVTVVKPVTSIWQILGLYVLFSLIF